MFYIALKFPGLSYKYTLAQVVEWIRVWTHVRTVMRLMGVSDDTTYSISLLEG